MRECTGMTELVRDLARLLAQQRRPDTSACIRGMSTFQGTLENKEAILTSKVSIAIYLIRGALKFLLVTIRATSILSMLLPRSEEIILRARPLSAVSGI